MRGSNWQENTSFLYYFDVLICFTNSSILRTVRLIPGFLSLKTHLGFTRNSPDFAFICYLKTHSSLGGNACMDGNAFSEQVQAYLRASGHSQQHLADTLGLHPGVLNRKLRGKGNAYLTQMEIKRIILTLAQWQAITEQREALCLLDLAHLKQNNFSAEEWKTSPLVLLETEAPAASSNGHAHARPAAITHNLPAPVTRLIGREQCVTCLEQLLVQDAIREVTITGVGGSGKTRLALHVASDLLPLFPGGIWFASLEGGGDPARVAKRIGEVLGITAETGAALTQKLVACLREKKLLLALDGFEQAMDAAPLVGTLLAEAPMLKILITSRSALHLYGEHQFSLPPLALPDPDCLPAMADFEQYESVQLFLERARAAVPTFTLTEENKVCIARICAAVDGLPLALELAAARVKVLSPSLLLERLSKTLLNVLTRGASNLPWRQQTLRRTFESSYALLSSMEQRCFMCLGVFCGGCSLQAAEEMIEDIIFERQRNAKRDCLCALDILSRLVDSSLLIRQATPDEQIRFTMLNTTRSYALELLSAQGEFEGLSDWHARYYSRLVKMTRNIWLFASPTTWQDQLAAEQENLRMALRWLLMKARSQNPSI
jgi:predicted ATPase